MSNPYDLYDFHDALELYKRSEKFEPEDKILWVSHNDRLPISEYHIRFPPKSAVSPCNVKCPECKKQIDFPFEVLEQHRADNESIFDIDCPHCWKAITYTESNVVKRLVKFRQKCAKFINPPFECLAGSTHRRDSKY